MCKKVLPILGGIILIILAIIHLAKKKHRCE